VFICVKNYIICAELWVDEVYEMIAEEVKGRDPKITREIVSIYRAPNEDMWQTGLDIWEELRSIPSLEVISTYFMWIGMVTWKSPGGPRYF
jgi:hypothetical protein